VRLELTATVTPSAQLSSAPEPGGGLLFKLPAELRNVVYELAVARRRCIVWVHLYVVDERGELALEHENNAIQPALTRTCSAIRTEALPIFYELNTFILNLYDTNYAESACQWLRVIGKTNRNRVKEVLVLDREWKACGNAMDRNAIGGHPFLWAIWRIMLPDLRTIHKDRFYVCDLLDAKNGRDLERLVEEEDSETESEME